MSNEPNLVPGDDGEYVTHLQERLQQLGYYQGSVDGYYGSNTETAVQQFQEAAGLEQDGQFQETTWAALEQHEQLNGGGGGGGGGDGDIGGSTEIAIGQLSEDGQWRWDGTDWQAVEDQATTDAGSGQPELQLSPDGQWQWDGSQWLPVGGATATLGFALDGETVDAGLPQPQAGPFGTADQSDRPGLKTASTASALTGFETGLADLLPEHIEILDGIVADLNAHPLLGGYVTLVGGADRRGDEGKNKELGQSRAESVRQYLVARIQDEDDKNEIRAYSLGEPTDAPDGDQPDQRRVDITINRRTIQMPKPHPTDPLPKGQQYKLPDRGTIPGPWPWPDPPFSWVQIPPLPPNKDYVTQLNEWLDRDVFNTDDLERLGGDIASIFGQDRSTVRNKLDEAFKAGKQAAVKAAVQAFVNWLKGALSTPPPGQPQGPPDPIPFPDVPQGPTIRF